jgi:hypothetical protein
MQVNAMSMHGDGRILPGHDSLTIAVIAYEESAPLKTLSKY